MYALMEQYEAGEMKQREFCQVHHIKNDIEPFAWHRDVLIRSKEHPVNRIGGGAAHRWL